MLNSQLDLLPKTFDHKAAVPVPPLPVPGAYKFTEPHLILVDRIVAQAFMPTLFPD